jgi:hypothetical protein
MQINGRTVYEYQMTLFDNSWLAFGKPSLHGTYKQICVEPEQSLNDAEKTMVFASLNDSENQIIQLFKDHDTEGFCTDSYPDNAIVKLIACSMDNYVDLFYTDELLRNIPDKNLEISQEVSGIEEILRRLSAI